MENKEQIIELLDAYLSGSMPEKEKQQLESRLATDSDFRMEWEVHQQMVGDIKRIAWRNEQREKIKAALNEKPASVRKIPIRILLAIAATILFLIVSLFLFDPFSIQSTDQVLVNEDSISDESKEPKLEEKDDIKAAKSNDRNVLKGSISVKQLISKDGKTNPGTSVQVVFVEIRKDKEKILKYRFLDNKLIIFTDRPEAFLPSGLKIVKLQDEKGGVRYYLNNGDHWYLVLVGAKVRDLLPKQDETLLRLLNES